MAATVLGIIGSLLLIVIGLWKRGGRIAEAKRKQAEQARKDLDSAKENNSPSDFLDGFGGVR
jgi:type II secretory pathway pseudopilin PulG